MFILLTICVVSVSVVSGQDSTRFGHYPSAKDVLLNYLTASSTPSTLQHSDAYSDRRNFDRDGLLVNPVLASGLYGNGVGPLSADPSELTPPITASPLLAPRPFVPPLALAQAYGAPPTAYSGYLPNGDGVYYGSQGPNHQSYMYYSGPETYGMSAGPASFGPAPYGLSYAPSAAPGPFGLLAAAAAFPFINPRMSPAFAQGLGYMGFGVPKIELGQKLSNSIYANTDSLRYDLSSVKDSYSPSYSTSSSSSRYPSSYSAQTNAASSSPGSSTYSPSSSSGSYQGDYALASNGYRQYLGQQPSSSSLLSSPALYNRVSQYLPYMAPSSSSFGNNNGGSSSSYMNDPNRSPDSLYPKSSDLYYKSSSSSSGIGSLSPSPSANSGIDLSGTKSSKVSTSKEEIGFFKRSDLSNHKSDQ